MHNIRLFLTLAVLFTMVFSAPTRPQRVGRSFKIPRLRQESYIAHGPTALRKAYRKFGFQFPGPLADSAPPATQINAASSNSGDEGAVRATPSQGDVEFVAPVTIGGQTVMMDFDTGSSDFWVMSTALPASFQQGHTIFDPSKSSTFKVLADSTFNISYGDSSFARGPVGIDTINIGGATVTAQAIGLPTEVSQSFRRDTASNGLVGLAFSKINTIEPKQQRTFFSNVLPSLDEPVMTANLRHSNAGAYEFGRVDTSQFSGELHYVEVDQAKGFWQFDSASFAIGDNKPQTTVGGSGTAIADTGTSLMLVDDGVAEAYYAAVDGATFDEQQGGFVFPCNSQLPDLNVAVGSQYMAKVPGALINFSRTGQASRSGDEVCFGGVQGTQGGALQIYGDVFLKSQFVAFNGGNMTIGIAPHA